MLSDNYEWLKKRHLEYWNKENHDRPLICAEAPLDPHKRPAPLPAPATLKECWENTDYVTAKARHWLENTYFGGETVPAYCPNLGPDILGAIAGCEIEYGEHTSWAHPCVKDWNTHPALIFDENNRWWKKIEEITKAAVEDAKNDCLVCITDLHSGTDGLVSLRGPETLCCDLIDNEDAVLKRLDEIFIFFTEIYNRLDKIISPKQEGTINWMGLWHPTKKWYVTSSDFSCLIGKEDFEKFIIPGLMKELNFLDASIYHLDGPGALRHTDRLLEIPELNGIQWVYGAGQPSASHWIELLQKIQNAGKLIQVTCNPDEVEILCKELKPEGVQLMVNGCKSREEIENLLTLAERTVKDVRKNS